MSQALQKVKIEVNESGTVASSSTGESGSGEAWGVSAQGFQEGPTSGMNPVTLLYQAPLTEWHPLLALMPRASPRPQQSFSA